MNSELDFLAYTADSFGPTKTYARREFCWIPVKEHGPDNLLGRLVIKLQHAKSGVHRNVEVDSYLVEQDTPEPGDHGGRAFWVHNQTDPRAEVYRCVVGGLTPHCGCKAGRCGVPADEGTAGCKHRDALVELIARELIITEEFANVA